MTQLINKPIEEMTIEELKRERAVHSWQATKSKRGAEALQKRLYWLEESQPVLTTEEINRAYADGELTQGQYKTAFARRGTAISYRNRAKNQAEYSMKREAEERALIGLIDERILELEATAPAPKIGRPPKRDPRKRQVKQRTYKRPRNLESLQDRWRIIEKSNKDNKKLRERLAPVPNWRRDKLDLVARDRGFFEREHLIWHLSKELEISCTATEEILRSGKFTFGQALITGAFLQMTPKEFCDIFLYDYFQDFYGVYEATIDNKQPLLDNPKRRG